MHKEKLQCRKNVYLLFSGSHDRSNDESKNRKKKNPDKSDTIIANAVLNHREGAVLKQKVL